MLDLVFLALLAFFLFRGYRSGMVVAICSFLAMILGVVGAMKLSAGMAKLFFKEDDGTVARWALMITYILLFVVIVWLVRLLASFIQKSMKVVMLGWLDKMAGALLYSFIFCFIWSIFLWLGDRIGIVGEDTKSSSRSWAYVAPVAPWMFSSIGKVVPFVQSAYEDVNGFYDNVGKSILPDVDPD